MIIFHHKHIREMFSMPYGQRFLNRLTLKVLKSCCPSNIGAICQT